MASKETLFPGYFKTVKVDKGKYDLFYFKDEKDEKGTKIGTNTKLEGAKEDAKAYAREKMKESTHVKLIHHKPDREKDAKEKLSTKPKLAR